MSAPTETEVKQPHHSFVCWSPCEETLPELVVADNGQEAAKLFVLRDQASPGSRRHDNEWSAAQVLVVNYATGDSLWFTVKVTVEAHQ